MPPTSADPVRATLVAILQQLNQATEENVGSHLDQALTLTELDRRHTRFWAVERENVRIPLALGLLVRNGLVQASGGSSIAASTESRTARYEITPDGKRFLIDALQKSDRIP